MIINNCEDKEYFFEEGCFILELSNSDNDPALSVARARVTPNTETKLHRLKGTVERYVILQGLGQVVLGEQAPQHVQQHDVVIIPENCPQAIRNTGNEDLIFLVLCSPRFKVENYEEV